MGNLLQLIEEIERDFPGADWILRRDSLADYYYANVYTPTCRSRALSKARTKYEALATAYAKFKGI